MLLQYHGNQSIIFLHDKAYPHPQTFLFGFQKKLIKCVDGKVEDELRGQTKKEDWRPCNIESFFSSGRHSSIRKVRGEGGPGGSREA